MAKCIIEDTGNIEFGGEFSRTKLITILRQELIFQKAREKEEIQKTVLKEGAKQNEN